MFTVWIITLIITGILVAIGVSKNKDGGYGDGDMWFLAAVIVFLVTIIPFFASARWQISSQNLTGYIYQRSESFGYVSYDLRYSQGAGTDSQPSFCVEAGSDQDKKMSELVGKETKVSITVPSSGFKMVSNPFECSSFAILEKAVDTKEPLQ